MDQSDPRAVHEAGLLQLSTDKAHSLLHWSPVWNFAEAIAQTTRWYRENQGTGSAAALTGAQIAAYSERARQLGVAWAVA